MATLQHGRMNATLVACHAVKPPGVKEFVEGAQAELDGLFGATFTPYDLEQVHATIIGLEGRRIGEVVLNTNYLQRRQELRAIDFAAIIRLLREGKLFPIKVRIGGYKDGESYPFTSRSLHPYFRSFSLQGDIAVAMGWPFDGQRYPFILDRIRRRFNEAGVLHKYHATPDDVDNDFFFVLGRINKTELRDSSIQTAQDHMRAYFADREPLVITVELQHLFIAVYVDEKLPQATTYSYPLKDVEAKLSEITSLYAEVAA